MRNILKSLKFIYYLARFNPEKYPKVNIIDDFYNGINGDNIPLKILDRFRDKYKVQDIFSYFNRLKKLKVLVIGDLIIDEYCPGTHLGKMRRESIVEFMVYKKERYLGGSGIIANHLSVFIDKVDLLTLIGERNSQEDLINENIGTLIKSVRNITFLFS